MVERDERRAQAASHNALMKGAFAHDTEACIEGAVIYEEGEGRELPVPDSTFEDTETIVTSAFAPEALYRLGKGKTVMVDPASFLRPGGAYEDGAFGPEQILCSESNLYQILCGIRTPFYSKNKGYARGQLFTDRAVYLPDVTFSRDGDVRHAGVIVIAEPLRARALENYRSERECDNALATRIETLLRIAAANECETLVCNAFGCGRMGYDEAQVIELFKTWIEAHPGAIARIVFSVPRAHYTAFDAAFGKPKEAAPVVSRPRDDGDEDEFDWRNVKLPEGVTLR